MSASPASSIKGFAGSAPAVAPKVAFGGLDLLLESMLKNSQADFATCDFCQTLNHRTSSRCKGCAGKLPSPADDVDATRRATRQRGAPHAASRRELSNVLLWVLAIPLAMFVAFACWQQSNQRASRVAALRTEPASTQSARQPPSMRQLAALAEASPRSVGGPQEAVAKVLATDSRPTVLESEEIVDSGQQPDAQPTQAARPARAKLATATASRRSAIDPAAACDGENFFMRAICINRTCAEAQASRSPRCLQAIKQRRIDEVRRNPTVVG